jgi:hypothetical protein
MIMEKTEIQELELHWKSIYRLGAIAALMAVFFGVLEILITFLPGGERVSPELLTVPLWFERFQTNPLLELRNLGLVNIILTAFGLLLSFALFAAHRKVNPGWAGLALVTSAIGGAVFFATNRCFSMLSLSNRYAAATNEIQRAADLLGMGIPEVKNRVTITGAIEIGRAPGVVQVTLRAPLEKLRKLGLLPFARDQYGAG